MLTSLCACVALLAEGVDRNLAKITYNDGKEEVALLAEGVDRNIAALLLIWLYTPSPSSRRAWIEIFFRMACSPRFAVALLAEGVDRNFETFCKHATVVRRPPRGGRG